MEAHFKTKAPEPELSRELLAERTAQLEQTISALEGFCYTLSHDLRAPLRSMEGFAQALLEDYRDSLDATGIDYAQRICAGAHRLDRMIQALLEYEQLTLIEPVATRVMVEPMMDALVHSTAEEIDRRGAKVVIERPLGTLQANNKLLEKVVRELLCNALRFVPAERPPAIRISTQQSENRVALLVEDNGIGIAPEHRRQIFEPFVRLHPPEAFSGIGMGLAMVNRSVERMKGTVEVESTVGMGSCFRVQFPRG